MKVSSMTQIGSAFLSLPRDEREAIISHGAALRLSSLRQRLFLAQSKVRAYEQKYHTSIRELRQTGLPDDAGYELHEDYIVWAHWAEVAESCAQDVVILEKIANRGLVTGGLSVSSGQGSVISKQWSVISEEGRRSRGVENN